jgi:hypothetical protein
MNTVEVLAAINEVMDEFITVYAEFDADEINEIPYEGSWTPGQTVQHNIMSLTFFSDLMSGPDAETNRLPDMHVENLKAAFLNFEIKMQSPEFIIPPAIDYDQQEQLEQLEALKEKINQIIPKADMSKTCTGFQLPVMGYITRTEIAHFIVYHTARHVHQLKKQLASINSL